MLRIQAEALNWLLQDRMDHGDVNSQRRAKHYLAAVENGQAEMAKQLADCQASIGEMIADAPLAAQVIKPVLLPTTSLFPPSVMRPSESTINAMSSADMLKLQPAVTQQLSSNSAQSAQARSLPAPPLTPSK